MIWTGPPSLATVRYLERRSATSADARVYGGRGMSRESRLFGDLAVALPNEPDLKNAIQQPIYTPDTAEWLHRLLEQFEAMRTRGEMESRNAYLGRPAHH
jgi:hypothetical protein